MIEYDPENAHFFNFQSTYLVKTTITGNVIENKIR
jgi:putative cofactor-binding repeat protein